VTDLVSLPKALFMTTLIRTDQLQLKLSFTDFKVRLQEFSSRADVILATAIDTDITLETVRRNFIEWRKAVTEFLKTSFNSPINFIVTDFTNAKSNTYYTGLNS
jgi:hypothetical protein